MAFAITRPVVSDAEENLLFKKNMLKCWLPIRKNRLTVHFLPEYKMLKKLSFSFVIAIAASASAQTATDLQAGSRNSAYLQDGRGVIVRSPFGLCWRTGYWTPADAVPGCDGQLTPPIAKITAPAMATAPAPAPKAPTPLKRCDFTVTLINDQTFLFNKVQLSNAAKERIDTEVTGNLAACSKIERIAITGHADRLGSQQYNQKLSAMRAEAVAAYLKNKGTSAPIETFGAGKAQPIHACSAKLSRKKLIECLAPNRRVVIEVHGLAK